MPNTPINGASESMEPQDFLELQLQAAASANGNGTTAPLSGFGGAISVRLLNTGAGTCTLTLEGSFDATTWHACGYQRVDGQAIPVRSASGISVGATGSGTDIQVLQVLDTYLYLRARISATVAPLVLDVQLYAVPV